MIAVVVFFGKFLESLDVGGVGHGKPVVRYVGFGEKVVQGVTHRIEVIGAAGDECSGKGYKDEQDDVHCLLARDVFF